MCACYLAVTCTETSAEPSLQAKQLQLKRARLADDLNDKISHRPGPIELVHKNILSVTCTVHSPLGNYTQTSQHSNNRRSLTKQNHIQTSMRAQDNMNHSATLRKTPAGYFFSFLTCLIDRCLLNLTEPSAWG